MTIPNILNNYFSSIANNTKPYISFSHKPFSDFLKSRSNISFFVNPTDKKEIENVISSLDSNKSLGSNSIPTTVLKSLKNDISSQLSEIFNISFSSGVFPSILKSAKVIPVHKKDSKLVFSNYRPISLLSNIEKVLERLMYNRNTNSSLITKLSIPYHLALDKNIQQFMPSLALLKILEKTYMKEILAEVFLSTYRKYSILLNTIVFYQNLHIMLFMVLLMNGLNLIFQIENNMFQLMVMALI